jgi:hypothetical protein
MSNFASQEGSSIELYTWCMSAAVSSFAKSRGYYCEMYPVSVFALNEQYNQ